MADMEPQCESNSNGITGASSGPAFLNPAAPAEFSAGQPNKKRHAECDGFTEMPADHRAADASRVLWDQGATGPMAVPGSIRSGSIQPGLLQHDFSHSDGIQSGFAQPDFFWPGGIQPGMFQPGVISYDGVHPGGTHPYFIQSDLAQPDFFQPGVFQPNIAQSGDTYPFSSQWGDFRFNMQPPITAHTGQSLDAGHGDYAYNTKKSVCLAARPGRQQKLVVRFRKAATYTTDSDTTLADVANDTTDAGRSWSTAELAVANVPLDELALVVGILLLPGEVEQAISQPALLAIAPLRQVVVRLQGNYRKDLRLSVLANKKRDGLCEAWPLPRLRSAPEGDSQGRGKTGIRLRDCIMWYIEYIHGAPDSARARQGYVRDSVRHFADGFKLSRPVDQEAVMEAFVNGTGSVTDEVAKQVVAACETRCRQPHSRVSARTQAAITFRNVLALGQALRDMPMQRRRRIKCKQLVDFIIRFCRRAEIIQSTETAAAMDDPHRHPRETDEWLGLWQNTPEELRIKLAAELDKAFNDVGIDNLAKETKVPASAGPDLATSE